MKDWKCKIKKLHTPNYVEEECVVVIDVIRAFTTAAFAFAKMAKKIILVSTVEEAFSLKKSNPDYLLMGEVGGLPIKGFDFGNSPIEIGKGNLSGETLVQRTSAGTQGAIRSLKSKKVLASSFAVAEGTLKRIRHLQPDSVTFVITGSNNGDEDLALADYLEECLLNGTANPQGYLQRVKDSPDGKRHFSSEYPHFPEEDMDAIVQLNALPFSMELIMDGELPTLTPTLFDGTLWNVRP